MLFHSFLSSYARARSFSLVIHSRSMSALKSRANLHMDREKSNLIAPTKHTATFRLSNVSGRKADLLEIQAKNPTLHVLFIPGNPGVISFYTDFLESLYELLGGTASITAIGQISQMRKNLEGGRLFSLEEQIDHKVNFINQELNNIEVPIVLVAHSIGCYMSIELLRRFSPKVLYCIELYPFLAINKKSFQQSVIRKITASPFSCAMLSSIVALLGLLPASLTRFLARNSVGKSWSSTAVDALCDNLLQYHTMQNVFFMARIEFIKMRVTWVSGDNSPQQVQYGNGKSQTSVVTTFSQNMHVLNKYANKDVSLGSWFIGLDVEHIDDRRLCCGTPPGIGYIIRSLKATCYTSITILKDMCHESLKATILIILAY